MDEGVFVSVFLGASPWLQLSVSKDTRDKSTSRQAGILRGVAQQGKAEEDESSGSTDEAPGVSCAVRIVLPTKNIDID